MMSTKTRRVAMVEDEDEDRRSGGSDGRLRVGHRDGDKLDGDGRDG